MLLSSVLLPFAISAGNKVREKQANQWFGYGAGGGIRTHEPLQDRLLKPTPLTWLGDPCTAKVLSHLHLLINTLPTQKQMWHSFCYSLRTFSACCICASSMPWYFMISSISGLTLIFAGTLRIFICGKLPGLRGPAFCGAS